MFGVTENVTVSITLAYEWYEAFKSSRDMEDFPCSTLQTLSGENLTTEVNIAKVK
jgi:hypothetical protein